MSEQDIAAEVIDKPQPLPGAALRQAREQQGLTLGEVSGVLKFSIRQIEALENDDFQQLPGKTFLRGFIRAYARLLKLPSDPLVGMLEDESSPPAEQIVVPANMGETNPVPFYQRHAKKLGITLILLLLLAGIIWYVGIEHQAPPIDVAQTTKSADVHPEPTPDVTPAKEFALSTTLQPTEAVATLSFEFSGRSWLEVKDANGQVLLTGEFPAGQIQTASGKPPYQIWIGNVPAVKLSYGGHAIDLQPHVREGVARFTLE